MLKKISAVVILAAASLFFIPLPATAESYVPVGAGGSSTLTVVAGAANPVAFGGDTFVGGEPVTVTVIGTPDATLGMVKVDVSRTYSASKGGGLQFTVTIPKSASASSYSINAKGASNRTASFTINSTPTDSALAVTGGGKSADSALALTGGNLPVVIIWGGAGILILGVALLIVFNVVRRQRIRA